MTRIHREAKLAAPVAAWLETKGLTVYAEVPIMYRNVDMMGIRKGCSENEISGIVMVELKTSLTISVRRQTGILQLITPNVYCGVGTNPNRSSIAACQKRGLGILSIRNGVVVVVLEPSRQIDPVPSYVKRCLEYADLADPGHDAGRPNVKGEGPAQDVERLILEYRKDHPEATWKELYKKIPNHYANYRSMQGAIRLLKERRAWNKRLKKIREKEGGAK